MMLRPATPLTLAFLVAFVLLLLATLSTPIIKAIPLGQNGGFNFGVFGFCPTDGGACSSPTVGYPPGELNSPSQQDYTLTSGARRTLSYILIVHPIAAFLVLVCTILAFVAHFRGPAHSPRYLLFLLILTFPTLLITLLAFLVDILIFIPHPQWGTWIVLPATIIVTACGVFTCAMRRTLVSRKARKKRIAENEDMNGSNYYAMKQELAMRPPESSFGVARAESPPPIDTTQDRGIATFDKMGGTSPYAPQPEDERAPLTGRDPSLRSANVDDRNGMHGTVAVGRVRTASRTRDDDPMTPISPMDGAPRSSSDSRRMRGGPMPPYGRGGPPPPGFYGRGGRAYPPRGGGPPRGYYGPPRGGYPPRGGPPPRGGYRGGPPPPGWNAGRRGPMMRGRGPPPPGYMEYAGQSGPHSRSSSTGRSPSRRADYGQQPPMSYDGQGGPQGEGQWLEQDPYAYGQGDDQAMYGAPYGYDTRQSPSQSRNQSGRQSPSISRRPSEVTRDPATFGFSGRQPSAARGMSSPRSDSPPPPLPTGAGMPSSPLGQEVDIGASGPSNDVHQTYIPINAYRQDDPSELPVNNQSPTTAIAPQQQKPNDFYEDIEPRFSEDAQRRQQLQQSQQSQQQTYQDHPSQSQQQMPNALLPSQPQQSNYQPQQADDYANDYADYGNPHYEQTTYAPPQSHSYDTHRSPLNFAPPPQQQQQPHDSYMPNQDTNMLAPTGDGRDSNSRSPAHSDNSTFTSISQRGINPAWQPGVAPLTGRGPPPSSMSRARQQQEDLGLSSNPDFVLPGAGPGRRLGGGQGHMRGLSSSGGGGGVGGMPGSRYPGT